MSRHKTYRIDIRRPPPLGLDEEDHPEVGWKPQTRKGRRRDAEIEASLWRDRNFEVRLVEET